MENKEFKAILHRILKDNGFEKIKNKYYRLGDGFLCEIYLQKSYYDSVFYVNFDFYLGEFKKPYVINRTDVKEYTPSVDGRFSFGKGKYGCEYLLWAPEQLMPVLLENMQRVISPPFDIGIQYLREHYGKIYVSSLTPRKAEEILINGTGDSSLSYL